MELLKEKNKALEDRPRTSLCENDLLNSLWDKAINTVNYVLNRWVIRSILKKTLNELFKCEEPTILYFKAFRSKCSIHNNDKENLAKFDVRSDEGTFVGYSFVSKAYCVLANVPMSLRNLFMLCLMKLTTFLLAHLYFMSYS